MNLFADKNLDNRNFSAGRSMSAPTAYDVLGPGIRWRLPRQCELLYRNDREFDKSQFLDPQKPMFSFSIRHKKNPGVGNGSHARVFYLGSLMSAQRLTLHCP